MFGGSAPPKPQLSKTATTDASARTTTPDGAWKVVRAKNVFVGYRVTEVYAGDTIHKSAAGRTGGVDGTMTIVNAHVSQASVQADVTTLTSNRGPRDNYIRTHALETDKFPAARFDLSSPIALPAPVRAGVKVHARANGQLTLHGVTKLVTIALDARWDGATVEVAGTAPVRFSDYGIEPPDTGVVKVDDHGSLELQLTFRRA